MISTNDKSRRLTYSQRCYLAAISCAVIKTKTSRLSVTLYAISTRDVLRPKSRCPMDPGARLGKACSLRDPRFYRDRMVQTRGHVILQQTARIKAADEIHEESSVCVRFAVDRPFARLVSIGSFGVLVIDVRKRSEYSVISSY